MKFIYKILIGLALCAGAGALSTHAQSVQPPAAEPSVASSNTLTQAATHIFNDGKSALTGLDFSQGFSAGIVGLKHSAHDFGGGVTVHTALPNSIVQAGFGVFALQETDSAGKKSWGFYDATISLSMSHITTVPYLNIPVRVMVESGPAYDVNGGTVLEQSAAYADYDWHISAKDTLTVGAGIIHCSKWSGDVIQMLHINFTRTF